MSWRARAASFGCRRCPARHQQRIALLAAASASCASCSISFRSALSAVHNTRQTLLHSFFAVLAAVLPATRADNVMATYAHNKLTRKLNAQATRARPLRSIRDIDARVVSDCAAVLFCTRKKAHSIPFDCFVNWHCSSGSRTRSNQSTSKEEKLIKQTLPSAAPHCIALHCAERQRRRRRRRRS